MEKSKRMLICLVSYNTVNNEKYHLDLVKTKQVFKLLIAIWFNSLKSFKLMHVVCNPSHQICSHTFCVLLNLDTSWHAICVLCWWPKIYWVYSIVCCCWICIVWPLTVNIQYAEIFDGIRLFTVQESREMPNVCIKYVPPVCFFGLNGSCISKY